MYDTNRKWSYDFDKSCWYDQLKTKENKNVVYSSYLQRNSNVQNFMEVISHLNERSLPYDFVQWNYFADTIYYVHYNLMQYGQVRYNMFTLVIYMRITAKGMYWSSK